MTLYYILFFTLMLFGFLEVICPIVDNNEIRFRQKRFSNIKYVILPFFLILFMGVFRETTVGYDHDSYYYSYWLQRNRYSWSELFCDYSIDNGFYLILKIIGLFTDDYWVARAALFSLTFLLFFFVIKKESPYPTVSLLIFVGIGMIGLMFGILRQTLAVAICFVASDQFRKKNWGIGVLLIIVAITIHKTAFWGVFILLAYALKIRKLSGRGLVVLSIVVYVAFHLTMPFLLGEYANTVLQNGGYNMLLFMTIVLVMLFHLMTMTDSNQVFELAMLFNLSCGSLMVQLGAIQWSLLTRTASYFSVYWCLLFPRLICKLSLSRRLMYYFVLVVLFGVMFFFQLDAENFFVMHSF